VLNDKERLEDFLKLIEELIDENKKVPIIVEGKKDRRALKALGFKGSIYTINHGIPLFNFCEEISRKHDKVIILTDWDSRGGRTAKILREGFAANGVKYGDDARAKLARICKKDVKDIEALPKFLEGLRKRIDDGLRKSVEDGQRRRRHQDRSG
jgi:5S rRNA maturation endonuclease (ribonuclease M5)